jgi:hypothetical protein
MAIRKRSPSLFPAKARITPTEGSTQSLQFLARLQENRNLYTFACEAQPRQSATTYGRPSGVRILCKTNQSAVKPNYDSGNCGHQMRCHLQVLLAFRRMVAIPGFEPGFWP